MFDTVRAGILARVHVVAQRARRGGRPRRAAAAARGRSRRRAAATLGRAGPGRPRATRSPTSRSVGDVRGLGLMIGIELVPTGGTKEPFPRHERVTERVARGRPRRRPAPVLEHRARRRHERRPGDARTAVRASPTTRRAARRADGRRDTVRSRERRRRSRRCARGARLRPRTAAPAPPGARAADVGADRRVRPGRAPGVDRARARARRRRRRSASCTRRRSSTPRGAPATARTGPGAGSATGPATTRSSPTCTRRPRSWPAPRVAAARAVVEGRAQHAFNAAGGLHHAMPGRASGFCVYDDPAVGDRVDARARRRADRVRRRRRAPRRRRAGRSSTTTPRAHGLDPRVRARGRFFPGTGSRRANGAGDGRGHGGQRPVAARHRRRRVARRVPRRRAARPSAHFAPGRPRDAARVRHAPHRPARAAAAHHAPPTARRRPTLHGLAHEAAGGRWVATGGGGYQWASVVPRAWTTYFAEMADAPSARRAAGRLGGAGLGAGRPPGAVDAERAGPVTIAGIAGQGSDDAGSTARSAGRSVTAIERRSAVGMHPVPRPPLGFNPRRPEEQDLDDAAERDHRARDAAGAPERGPIRRLLHAVRVRVRR